MKNVDRIKAIERMNSNYYRDPEVKALIEKKRNAAAKEIENGKIMNELLKDPFWCEVLRMYTRYRSLYCGDHSSRNTMLEAYEFKNSIENDVKSAVKKYIDEYWEKHMDNILNTDTDFGNYWAQQGNPLDTIVYILKNVSEMELWYYSNDGCCSSPALAPTNWKAFIVRHIASPLIEEEYHKLCNFWIKYKERSKRESQQPSPQEAKKIIKELEEKVKLLTERNGFLEEKFAIFSKVVSIN